MGADEGRTFGREQHLEVIMLAAGDIGQFEGILSPRTAKGRGGGSVSECSPASQHVRSHVLRARPTSS